jgi:hypothetical protein
LHHSAAGVDAELANLDRQIGNLTEAVAMGGNLSALVTRLQQTEEHRRRLLRQREE